MLFEEKTALSMKRRRCRKRKKQFHIPRSFDEEKKGSSLFLTRNSGTTRGTRRHRYRHSLLKRSSRKKWKERDSLVDVIEERDRIVVVAGLAGFKRENLKILVGDKRLTLSAEDSNRKYYKTLNLPKMVIRDTTDTSYKNGVLEIKLRKAPQENGR